MSYKLAGVIWNDDGTMATKEPSSLKALENIFDFIKSECVEDEYDEDYHIIETAFKALEIIKEKVNDIKWLKYCSSLEQYNAGGVPNYEQLTQEEFDILKKALK